MKTLFAALAFAAIVVAPSIAQAEESRATQAYTKNSVICGRLTLTDPDPRIRAGLLRDCTHHHSPGN
jgi:hypothetical protein